jgi:hypothetical protein
LDAAAPPDDEPANDHDEPGSDDDDDDDHPREEADAPRDDDEPANETAAQPHERTLHPNSNAANISAPVAAGQPVAAPADNTTAFETQENPPPRGGSDAAVAGLDDKSLPEVGADLGPNDVENDGEAVAAIEALFQNVSA